MNEISLLKWGFTLVKLLISWMLDSKLRKFKKFVGFHWLDTRKIKVIVAETYPATNTDGTTCQGIRATGEGQVYALFYILPWLVKVYGKDNIELDFSGNLYSLSKDEYEAEREKYKLVILGGPINNNWARAVMEFEQPQFTYRYMCSDDLLPEKDPHLLIDKSLGHSINKQENSSDYGLIVQVMSLSPHKGFDILLLSGNTTRGTAAAAKAVTSPAILEKIISKIDLESNGLHFTKGGCFYIKAQGANIKEIRLDALNSKYGNLKL